MDLDEAWEVLESTSTLGATGDRRMAALMVVEEDASAEAIDELLDEVQGAGRRQAIPETTRSAAIVIPQLFIADVVISEVLRHHPREDIVPVVARRLDALRKSGAIGREPIATWMAEALSFLLARRAMDDHRDVLRALWLEDMPSSGVDMIEKFGDDAMKAELAARAPDTTS